MAAVPQSDFSAGWSNSTPRPTRSRQVFSTSSATKVTVDSFPIWSRCVSVVNSTPGFAAPDAKFDPALASVERLIGDHAKPELVGVERQ